MVGSEREKTCGAKAEQPAAPPSGKPAENRNGEDAPENGREPALRVGRLKIFEELAKRVIERSVEPFLLKRSPECRPGHSGRVRLENLVEPEGKASETDETNGKADAYQEDSDRGKLPFARGQPPSAAGRRHPHDYLSTVKIYLWTPSLHRLWMT